LDSGLLCLAKGAASPHQLPVLRLMISAEENSTVPRIILREKSATTTVVLCHPIEERTICK